MNQSGMEYTKEHEFYYDIITDQVELLDGWNKENIKEEPEQARANVETILLAVKALKECELL
jgi:hypothetical protein